MSEPTRLTQRFQPRPPNTSRIFTRYGLITLTTLTLGMCDLAWPLKTAQTVSVGPKRPTALSPHTLRRELNHKNLTFL